MLGTLFGMLLGMLVCTGLALVLGMEFGMEFGMEPCPKTCKRTCRLPVRLHNASGRLCLSFCFPGDAPDVMRRMRCCVGNARKNSDSTL